MGDGGRYGRGGYRGNQGDRPSVVVGEEKPAEGAGEPDGNLLDGSNLGPQDPNNFPKADSDVGGPEVDKGGEGLPAVGVATPPPIHGENQRSLDELETQVEQDLELTPEVEKSEEQEIVDVRPAAQLRPESLPSDTEMKELEEPEDGETATGEGLTRTQLEAEVPTAGGNEPGADGTETDEPDDKEPDDKESDDGLEINAVGDDEGGESF